MNTVDRPREEALREGLAELDRLADRLDLDCAVKARAKERYREVVEAESGLVTGLGAKKLTAACLLLASRETNAPRTAHEIAEYTADHVEGKTILRASKTIRSDLDLGFVLADPHTYVDRVADAVGATEADREVAHEVVETVVEAGITAGHQANVVAGAAVYLAGNTDGGHGRYNQQKVAAAADTTTVSIRNNYPEFAAVIAASPDADVAIPFLEDGTC